MRKLFTVTQMVDDTAVRYDPFHDPSPLYRAMDSELDIQWANESEASRKVRQKLLIGFDNELPF